MVITALAPREGLSGLQPHRTFRTMVLLCGSGLSLDMLLPAGCAQGPLSATGIYGSASPAGRMTSLPSPAPSHPRTQTAFIRLLPPVCAAVHRPALVRDAVGERLGQSLRESRRAG